MNEYFVYVLYSASKKIYYKGMTKDVSRRVLEHNNGKCLSTKKFMPWDLVFVQICNNRNEARTMEKYLKSGSGRELINNLFYYYGLEQSVGLPAGRQGFNPPAAP